MTFVLVGGPMSEVQPEAVAWLWPGRIPFGKLTVIDGDPGLAKSILTLDLAARVTRGDPMPDGQPTEAGSVIVLTAEDGLGDTVRPRLDALDADVSKVFAYTGTTTEEGEALTITLPTHLDALADQVRAVGARLVIVDPLMAYVSPDVNTRIDHDVRRLLAQFTQLGEETGAAIVLVRHLNKGNSGPAIYRGGGSIGIIGAARSGLLVAKDPDDENRRVLAVVKSNLAREAPSLSFTVETAPNGAAIIAWRGQSGHTANALVAANGEGAGHDAVQFLEDFLSDGSRTVKELAAEARSAGFSERTVDRARQRLGVRASRTGGIAGQGQWVLSLPGKGANGRVLAFKGATGTLSEKAENPGTSPKDATGTLNTEDDPDRAARDAMKEGA
jgi:AAA domain-containing protein